MAVEQEMCSCLITASYDGIIRVWGRGLIRLFLFLIKVLKLLSFRFTLIILCKIYNCKFKN